MTPEQIKAIQENFAKVAPIFEAYGVKPAHHTPVGEAPLSTLQQGLGEAWTRELAAAWSAAYGVLSEYMIAEAYGRSAAAE